MADTVLESFLIKLGYQVDQASAKRFTTAITEGTRGIMEFAAALTAMAIGVEEAVRRTAAQMSRLQFTSTMAGRTAEELRRIGIAAEAVGASYEGAIQQQVKLNQVLTEAPWMKSFFRQQLAGHSADIQGVIERYHELSSQFGEDSNQVRAFARLMSEVFHIDMSLAEQEHRNWGLREYRLKNHNELVKIYGKRYEEYAKQAVRLTTEYGNFSETVDYMWKTAIGRLDTYFADAFHSINEWLKQAGPGILAFLDQVEAGVKKAVIAVGDWFGELYTKAKEGDWEGVGEQIGNAIAAGIKKVQQWIEDGSGNLEKWVEIGERIGQQIADGMSKALEREFPILKEIEDWLNDINQKTQAAGKVTKEMIEEKGPQTQWSDMGKMPWWAWALGRVGLLPGGAAGYKYEKGGIVPHFQQGGIMPAALHSGEMVHPKPISQGLQDFFGLATGNSWIQSITHWLTGDTSYQPVVQLADTVYQKLVDALTGGAGGIPGSPTGGTSGTGPNAPATGAPSGTPTPAGGPDDWYTGSAAPGFAEGTGQGIGWEKGGHNFGGIKAPRGGFRTYPSEFAGVADTLRLLQVYGNSGYNTLAKIYNRWAPASDKNNTNLLIQRAAEWMGVGPNDAINFNDPDVMAKLAIAMNRNEFGGKQQVPTDKVQEYTKRFFSGEGPNGPRGAGGPPTGNTSGVTYGPHANMRGVNQQLVEALTKGGSTYLPKGYSIQVNEGSATSGHVAHSAHYTGNALDISIIGPNGQRLPNEGAFGGAGSQHYKEVARGMYEYIYKTFGKERAQQFAWGGEFATTSGAADWMHMGFQRRGLRHQPGWSEYQGSSTTINNFYQVSDAQGVYRILNNPDSRWGMRRARTAVG